MKQFTEVCNPFNCKIFRFYFSSDGVKVVTGVAGDSELSSSPGGMDPEEGKQQPVAGSESGLAGEDVRAVSVPPRKGGRTFLELFPQLFGIPFLIVIVLVLVWVFFGAIAKDNRSVADLLRDIQAGGGHSRLQDAKALADQLVAKQATGEDPYLGPRETSQLLQLVENASSGEDQLRIFLVVALGRSGQPQQAVPFLLGQLAQQNISAELRQATIAGLAWSGDRKAIPALLDEVEVPGSPRVWGSRFLAIGGVVNILIRNGPDLEKTLADDPQARAVLDKLKGQVNDQRKEISWNTAFWLARHFGDDSGASILEEILDWDFLDRVRGDHNRGLTVQQKERWMCQALDGLYRLRGSEFRDVLLEKKTDRSLAVKDKALTLLELLDDKDT